MTISRELPGQRLKGCARAEDRPGGAGLMEALKIRPLERRLGAGLSAHPRYEDGMDAPADQANRRNGASAKRLKGQGGTRPVCVLRDRDGGLQPEWVRKGQTRIDRMDDKIIGLCAAGLTGRDIRAPLADVHGLKVSPVSRVTGAVLDDVREGPPGSGPDVSDRHFRRA